jgi:hypothetical protein
MESPIAGFERFNFDNCSDRAARSNFGLTESRPLPTSSSISEDEEAELRWQDDGGNQWIKYDSQEASSAEVAE